MANNPRYTPTIAAYENRIGRPKPFATGLADKPAMALKSSQLVDPGYKLNTYSKFRILSGKVGKGLTDAMGNAEKVVPYVSNLVNSFRKTPRPHVPIMQNAVGSVKLNFDDQRVEADRSVRGANRSADMMLDENTAGSLKAANLASGIRAKNSIATSEANANAQLAMQTNQMNTGIEANNLARMDRYNDDAVGAQIADQRERSANLSNAADKFVMQQNEKAKAKLDLDKLNVYKELWKNSGVYDRLLTEMEKQGITDPTGAKAFSGKAYGGRIAVFKNGGKTKRN